MNTQLQKSAAEKCWTKADNVSLERDDDYIHGKIYKGNEKCDHAFALMLMQT